MIPSVRTMQSVSWSLKHLWDIRFFNPKPPEPFGDVWFPASGISNGIFDIQGYNFETTFGSGHVPKSSNEANLPFSVTFYDTVDLVIEHWLNAWYDFMYPIDSQGNRFVRRLADVAGRVEVYQLSYMKKRLNTRNLFICLDGALDFTGESEAGGHIITQQFKIVGKV